MNRLDPSQSSHDGERSEAISGHKVRRLLIFLLFCSIADADYGWMPAYQSLFLSTGTEYYKTNQNFGDTGTRQNILLNGTGTAVQLTEYRFWVESEYGFAQDWSGRLRLNFFGGAVDGLQGTGDSLLSGGGIGDIQAGVKWRVYRGAPNLTFETLIRVPTYSNIVTSSNTLLPGNGNVDVGLALHIGYHQNYFFLNGSPQFVFRSGGFSQAVELKALMGVQFNPVYFYAFTDLFVSLGTSLLYDPSYTVHNAAGTGGSYALLSGSPNGISAGVKGGLRVVKDLYFEAFLEQAISGKRFPNFFQAGMSLMLKLNFFEPDRRLKIKEIPLDSEPESNPDS